jgi:hypothetical protein
MKGWEDRRAGRRPGAQRGQAMAEFAIAFGAFFLVFAMVVQFGLLLWSINSGTQVARDTARWAATQSTTPCNSSAALTSVGQKAASLAKQWGLLGYTTGMWTGATLGIDSTPTEGVGADWPIPPSSGTTLFDTDCPPADASTPWFVRVRVNHVVPVFFPGVQLLLPPCSSPGFCLSSTAEIRMEPKAP